MAFYFRKNIIGAWNTNKSLKKFYKFLKIFLASKVHKYFISKTYKLSNINRAFEDLKSGKVLRPTIKFKFS